MVKEVTPLIFIRKSRLLIIVFGLVILAGLLAGCEQKVEKGSIVLSDGAKYTGQYINNIPNGQGHLEAPDGTVYDGGFKNGKFEGKGKLVQLNKWEYEGEFKNGVPHGKGTATRPQGIKFYGIYKDGVLIKQLAKPTITIKSFITHADGTTSESLKANPEKEN
ncbi:MAG: hypothetical protein ACM3QZ_05450 [Solirubrobacterales bacterium]